MERDLIKSTQFIVSTANSNVRSVGDVMSTGDPLQEFARFDTVIVDSDYFEKYNQLILASGNRSMINQVGAVSLDGLFVAYSTSPYHTGPLPHFEIPTNSGSGVINVNSLNPFNPSNIYGSGVPNSGTVDSGVYYPEVWMSGGHNIKAAMVGNYYATDDTLEDKVHPVSNFFDADYYFRKKTELLDVRSVAHRAPLILSGPGYDINGNPVPTGVSGVMHPQAFSDPSLWKTGPLDVRWDDERKVWAANGGGGSDTIQFRPVDVCEGIGFTCDCVTAVVVTASCGSELKPGDEVQVWDQSRGWFNMPQELLFNSVGWAHRVKVTEADQYSLPFPIGDCRWVVFSMDCVEQEVV